MGQLVRTQVLLETSQHEALQKIAQREGRSISEVVREMVAQQIRQRIYTEMSQAAQFLSEDYRENDEFTEMNALDSEDFIDA